VGGYQWFLATPFGLLTAPLLTELNTNHLTGKRTPAAATKLQKTIYFNSISNKSRLELNVRQNGTIHEIQETHHVFFKKKKKKPRGRGDGDEPERVSRPKYSANRAVLFTEPSWSP
jgi:hypothetical protein